MFHDYNSPDLRLFLGQMRRWLDQSLANTALAFTMVLGWRPLAVLLLPGIFSAYVLACFPLQEAFEIGGDEGYELIKASLMLNGYKLYTEIWNDQPPFHSALLAAVLTTCGSKIGSARFLAVAFSALLILALVATVQYRSGSLAGLAAGCVLFGWAEFLPLSVSTMIEIPAIALAIASYAMAQASIRSGSRSGLWLSGLLCALALQTKMTAMIILPVSLLAWCWSIRKAEVSSGGLANVALRLELASAEAMLHRLRWWAFGLAIGLSALLLLFPGQLVRAALWAPHLSAIMSYGPATTMGLKLADLMPLRALLLAGALSAIWLLLRGDWASAVAPLVFVATVLGTHSVTRPFWPYYSLHFVIAAAWTIGAALGNLTRLGCVLWTMRRRAPRMAAAACLSLAAAATTGLAFVAAEGFRAGAAMIQHSRKLADAPAIEVLRRQAKGNRWLFTDAPIYAFHADLLIPPEVAVVPRKRLWSQGLSADQLTANLEEYKPHQILLVTDTWQELLRVYLGKHYTSRFDLCPGYYTRQTGNSHRDDAR
jgi:hypothetical protein